MITILIVDDDINKISKIIASAMSSSTNRIEIRQASNVQEALEAMRLYHFHLLITDLLMPLRKGEQCVANGGNYLVKEMYKSRSKVSIPLYIVGLTGNFEIASEFSNIWNVWKYEPENIEWENQLRDLIFHIVKINGKIVKEKIETLFVEGETDKIIVDLAIKLFHPSFENKVVVELTKYGGGSSWVERQLVIWGKTLFIGSNGKYLQSVGLFDNDMAGQKSMTDVETQIPLDTAGRETFSMFRHDQKYARHLIPIFKGGIILPITLEEMFSPECWIHARTRGWLKKRKLSEDLLQDPGRWDRTNQSLTEYTNSLNLPEENLIYIQEKIDDSQKVTLVNYIQSLPKEEQRGILCAFEPLLKDIFVRLGIYNITS
ncbi:hypothetical protein H9X96_21895 [Pedobacter sp. N36a]|uniref:response regulator transcription factor n=1 Tax=Pedobacter sp. N36a TaxID=2767996 RepID=UPI001656BC27|nr:hypothetical protein [Pedobacter sp. N36a]MBC8988412.1 hypothetical protein [Pedobacter sp. N36a]